jgi:hypothetical protein
MSIRHADTPTVLELLNLLSDHMLQREFGHFITTHRNRVHYPNHPEESKQIQRNLDELVSRMAVVYLFAVFDEYLTPAMENAIPANKKEMLGAYRHLRNCAAHGVLYKRSPRKDSSHHAYERTMKETSPLPGIAYHVSDVVFVGTGIELQCRGFLHQVTVDIFNCFENS